MKELNNKIRNDIANSYYLKNLSKDDRLTREQKNRVFKNIEEINKKIIFYKNLSNALKKVKNNDIVEKTK